MELPHVEPAQESIERLAHEVAELRVSSKRLVLDADAERRRIERDVHNGLQQHLVALAVQVQLTRIAVAEEPEALASRLDELARSVQEALDEAERLAHRIQPPLLEAGGLTAALRAAAASAGIRARAEVADAPGCPPELASTAYACWLAVLDHARAGTEATISVSDAGDTVTFEIAARTESPAAARDAVLDRLRDRVDALGGELTASTERGGLLRVRCSCPRS